MNYGKYENPAVHVKRISELAVGDQLRGVTEATNWYWQPGAIYRVVSIDPAAATVTLKKGREKNAVQMHFVTLQASLLRVTK